MISAVERVPGPDNGADYRTRIGIVLSAKLTLG
jgi:hypothetical protein